MQVNDLIDLFNRNKRRWHLIGNKKNGVVIGLDLQGRLYTFLESKVLNRVEPNAFASDQMDFVIPGGDGLWPAPEGTCLGYEYSTGKWRVPPGLVNAKFLVTEKGEKHATIHAEVDLINNSGLGVPTIFERVVSVKSQGAQLELNVEERVIYNGTKLLFNQDCLLVPWTLAQFECGPGSEVIFPIVDSESIWDLYDPSDSYRYIKDGFWHIKTDGTKKFQIGLDEKVKWIEYRDPNNNLCVRRTADMVPPEQRYIDIADIEPSEKPGTKGVRFSIYSDNNSFMEIEAVGGCPEKLLPGAVLSLSVSTVYTYLMNSL